MKRREAFLQKDEVVGGVPERLYIAQLKSPDGQTVPREKAGNETEAETFYVQEDNH